jgi:hypothetical protein
MPDAAPPRLAAVPALEAMLPRLRRMLPAGFQLELQTEQMTLLLEEAPLFKVMTQLALHGRQGLESGRITLAVAPADLAGRAWARAWLELSGPKAAWEGNFLGLSWLHKIVQECSGILEVNQDERGYLVPRVLLPRLSDAQQAGPGFLDGRRAWIVHHDAAVSRKLADAVTEAGGSAVCFADLRNLLEAAQRAAAPDVLVLERTRILERYQTRLCHLGGLEIPALLLDDGRPLPQGERAPRRLVLLEKPFPGPDFIPGMLALLH